MTRKLLITGAALLLALSLTSCNNAQPKTVSSDYGDAAKVLTEVKTTQFFTEEKVTDEDMEKILSAGVNAPGAMNTQPWHFTAGAPADAPKPPEGASGFSKMPNKAGIGDTPYILVVNCVDESTETAVKDILKKEAKKNVLKSKTVNKLGIELTYEIRVKNDDTQFVNKISTAQGVSNAVLVSYNGEYMS